MLRRAGAFAIGGRTTAASSLISTVCLFSTQCIGQQCSHFSAPTSPLLIKKSPSSAAAATAAAAASGKKSSVSSNSGKSGATSRRQKQHDDEEEGEEKEESTAAETKNAMNGEHKTTEDKSSSKQNQSSSSGNAIVPSHGAYIPTTGTVENYSMNALLKDGRYGIIEAPIWVEDSIYHPILSRGRKNVYEHTDDIPKDIKPMFGETQIWQTREYFEYKRNAEKLRYRFIYIGSAFMVVFGLAGGIAFTRIWVDQPSEVATLRRSLLGNAYGRVLELAAGQGINIGVYPFAVTDVVLVDYNPQELHILRSRLPRTAYPSYQVVCDRAEELSAFPDHCFDTVIDMFGLCHYKDAVTVLKQMQRVCKPTGQLLLLEHGKSAHWWVNSFLDYKMSDHFEATQGCQWNKDLKAIFNEAGLVIRHLETQHYGTTHIVVAHPKPPEVDLPLTAGGQPAIPVNSTVVPKFA